MFPCDFHVCVCRLITLCVRLLVIFLVFPSSSIIYADNLKNESKKGEDVYLRYCAGCHGFDGKAAYEYAPSFSLGDRLKKDDRELLQSVLNGKNNMPPWKDKLAVQDLRDAISYLRLMFERTEKGESPRQTDIPEVYYLFKPVGEHDMDWVREEVAK